MCSILPYGDNNQKILAMERQIIEMPTTVNIISAPSVQIPINKMILRTIAPIGNLKL